jgi:hypothetical protein
MRIYFLLCFILSSVAAIGQLEEGVLEPPIDLNKFGPFQLRDFYADISIDKPLPAQHKLPFSSIKIIDRRQDTVKIGFIPAGPNREGPYSFECMRVRGGLTYALENVLNEHYQPSFSNDSTHLYIVVKRFWADPFPNNKIEQTENIEGKSVFDIYFNFELFYEKNNLYYPLKKIDTLFQTFISDSIEGCSDRRIKNCKVYGYALAKVFEEIDFNFYASRMDKIKNKISRQRLDSFINKYNNYPILNDSVFQKGVYMSFEEFRNNNPSVKNYTTELLRKGANKMLVVYDEENGKRERIKEYWGYCDGENIFSKFTPYPLFRFGSTFEFFVDKQEYRVAIREYQKLHNKVGIFEPVFINRIMFIIKVFIPGTLNKAEPMQLDMETGNIY